MKVILYGATGMIGQGALIECLEDDAVEAVLAVGRRPTGKTHPKLRELELKDFNQYGDKESELAGYDACLFCLGISAVGMSDEDYRRITYEYAVSAGEALLRQNPSMRMCFISGAGTKLDSRQMWARVKAEAEQALLAMPWRSAHMFRPAGILPKKGVVSGVRSYRIMYATMGWAFGLFKAVAPGKVTTSDQLGRALIAVARDGHDKSILEGDDINAVID